MIQASSTASDCRYFSPDDLQILKALQAYPRPAGWAFHLDQDQTWELLSIQPPATRRAFHAFEAFRSNNPFAIIPASAGQGGVLMTAADGVSEVAYPSLSAALADVGPRKVSWRRCLG